MDKKEAVKKLLEELNKVINKAIDENRVDEYTPLDLVYMAVQELASMAMSMQKVADDFDNDDDTSGAGGSPQ